MEFVLGALVFGLGALFGAAVANAYRPEPRTREDNNGI